MKSWLSIIYKTVFPPEVAAKYTTGNALFSVAHTHKHQYGFFRRERKFAAPTPYNSTLELEAEAVIRNPKYFKFAIVRHPWIRLVSGYQDKDVRDCKKQRHCFGVRFHLPALLKKDRLLPVSFHEFVEALSVLTPAEMNPHFIPSSILCEFGKIPYNYIGELDNLDEMDYLSHYIGSPKLFTEGTSPDPHVCSKLIHFFSE